MPPAAFILMAQECARQLQPSVNPGASSTLLSDVIFDHPLQLTLFENIDTVIELHFLTHQLDIVDAFQFEIVSMKTESQDSPIRHCSGKLFLANTPIEDKGISSLTVRHNSLLLEHWPNSRRVLRNFKELKVSSEGQSGVFESGQNGHINYTMDPLVLDSILSLVPASVSSKNLLTSFSIYSIKNVLAPVTKSTNTRGTFITAVIPTQQNEIQSNIEISLGTSPVFFSGICYKVDQRIKASPVLDSLFFTPVIMPDISTLSPSKSISLSRCLKLVTHKWPMCDIGVTGVVDGDVSNILTQLPGTSSSEQSSFRSIHIKGEANEFSSSRVRFVDSLDPSMKFHLLFEGSCSNVKESYAQLHQNGLICVSTRTKKLEESFGEKSKFICTVTDSDNSGQWLMWQKQCDTEQSLTPRQTRIFACPKQSISAIDCLVDAEIVPLDPRIVRVYCERIETDRFDAVILDSLEKSVIATWPGEDILPWLQVLLKLTDSILWVTTRNLNSPHSNIAGNLLRTLQAEMPSLRVSWLILDGGETDSVKQARITAAYSSLLNGENELRLEVIRSEVNILRYYPDYELSATTGLILPRVTTGSIVEKDYELSTCTQEEPVILSWNRDTFHALEGGKVRVDVEASVVDASDILAVKGINSKFEWSGFGRFFAGRVTSGTEESFPIGSKVVGWHDGAHRNQLDVFPKCLLPYKESPPEFAAIKFAAIVAGLCVVDGVARARLGDTFRVEVDGILGEAIKMFCQHYNATVLDHNIDSANFAIGFSDLDGLVVNGSPIDIAKYLESERGARIITEAWELREVFRSPPNTFNLAAYRLAFNVPISKSYSTVLSHSDVAKVPDSVAVYKKPTRLFSNDGAYVIIGGLGGLGRFVCSWMVAHGAKKLVSISRKGLSSKEAQETFSTINASGVSLEVISADACDRAAVTDALDQIRKANPIKGIINMAMLLADAPLIDMVGWQWDRALRLKIDSSWILHEETLNDPLEFFIVYSSIASVLGNRNQAGYNVGNTFLNALAEYRHSLGLPAISIALGAMSESHTPCLCQTVMLISPQPRPVSFTNWEETTSTRLFPGAVSHICVRTTSRRSWKLPSPSLTSTPTAPLS